MYYAKNIAGALLVLAGLALVATVVLMGVDAASLAGAFMVCLIGIGCATVGASLIRVGK